MRMWMRSKRKEKDPSTVVKNAVEGDKIETESSLSPEDKYVYQKADSNNEDLAPQQSLLFRKPRQYYC